MKKIENKTVLNTESTYGIGKSGPAAVSKESDNDTITDINSDGVNEPMEVTNNEDSTRLLLNAMDQYECKLIREFND